MYLPFFLQFYIIATDQGVPSLASSVRVTVLIRRNRNAPVFRNNDYEETITEFTNVGRSVLRVVADDADNVSLAIFGYSVFQTTQCLEV